MTYNHLCSRGNALRSALDSWWTISQFSWESSPSTNVAMILAIVYYHATSIYLSGIFDHRYCLHDFNGPHLTQQMVDSHVDSILRTTEHALGNTKLTGVLFFFPLRVAGARVSSLQQRDRILGLLRSIKDRSFVVADAFTADLSNLWTQTDTTSILM